MLSSMGPPNFQNSEIPSYLSPKAELVSLKFCNASSTTQCTKHNVNVGTNNENNSEYTLTCPLHLPLP